MREKTANASPDPRYRQALGETLETLVKLFIQRGAVKEVEETVDRILANYRHLSEDLPLVKANRTKLGQSLREAAAWYSRLQPKKAVILLRQSVACLKELSDDFPDDPNCRHELAETRSVLGSILSQSGEREAASQELRQACSLLEVLIVESPKIEYEVTLGGAYCNLGHTVLEPEERLKWYGNAVTTLESVLKMEPKNKLARLYVSNAYTLRLKLLKNAKRYEAMVADLKRMIELSPARLRTALALQLAEAKLNSRNVRGAMEDVAALSALTNLTSVQWYQLALLSAVAGRERERS